MVAKGMNVNPDLCACNIDAKSVSAVPINTNMVNTNGTPAESTDTNTMINYHVGNLEEYAMLNTMKSSELNDQLFRLRKLINDSHPEESKQKNDWLDRLDNIEKYNTAKQQDQQQKTLDTLTIISTIFLPLTLIVGYYGMNFKTIKAYSTKKPHKFIFTLFAFAIMVVMILFKAGILSA